MEEKCCHRKSLQGMRKDGLVRFKIDLMANPSLERHGEKKNINKDTSKQPIKCDRGVRNSQKLRDVIYEQPLNESGYIN